MVHHIRLWCCLLLAAMMGFTPAGCSSLRVPLIEDTNTAGTIDDLELNPEQSQWLQALELRLGYENWIAAEDEELLQAYMESDSHHNVYRWKLGQLNKKILEQQLVVTTAEKAEQPSDKTYVKEKVKLIKFAEKLLQSDLPDEKEFIDESLEVLTKRDDIVGMNAKILYARRNPKDASNLKRDLKAIMLKMNNGLKREREQIAESETDGDSNSSTKLFANLQSLRWRNTGDPEAANKPNAVQSMKVAKSTSLAAAEVWCHVLRNDDSDGATEQSLAEAGEILQAVWIQSDLRSQLYRTLATQIPPTRLPRLNTILNHHLTKTHQSYRRETEQREKTNNKLEELTEPNFDEFLGIVDACRIHAVVSYIDWQSKQPSPEQKTDAKPQEKPNFRSDRWPEKINLISTNKDPRIRRLFIDWVAYSGHPTAAGKLKLLTSDRDNSVRTKAIEMLGVVRGEEAEAFLEEYASHTRESNRLAAMAGIARYDPARAIELFQDDESRDVRKKLAAMLTREPSSKSANALFQLATDASVAVQMQVLAGISAWPDDLAFPILIEMFVDGTITSRTAAYREIQLRRTVPYIELGDFRQKEERRRLITKWAHQYNIPIESKSIAAGTRQSDRDRRREENIRLVGELSEWKDATGEIAREVHTEELKAAISRENLETVQTFSRELDKAQRSRLFETVLVPVLPEFQAIHDLESNDVHERRRAAAKILSISDKFSLSPLAMEQLLEHMQLEQDKIVWHYVMSSLNGEMTSDGTSIAILAIRNRWPDIQVLGCDYLGRHRMKRFAHLLIPLFEHSQVSVQLAAIKAAGRCGNPIVMRREPSQRNLLDFLHEPRSDLRRAAVISLSQLNHPTAIQELHRLAQDVDPDVRIMVAKAYGETRYEKNLRRLIVMGRVENKRNVLVEIHQSLLDMVPESQRPATIKGVNNPAKAVKFWVEWYDAEKLARSETSSTSRAPKSRSERL